jgi:hypothetical protein
MNSKKIVIGILCFFSLLCSLNSFARDYYQLKVYTIESKTQEQQIETYLKNAYLPALHKAGIKTVGVFKPMANSKDFGTKIFVLVPLKDLNHAENLEDKILTDKTFLKAGDKYINADPKNPPYERIETILLRAFKDHPKLFIPNYKTPKEEQIFELRSYEGATEERYRKKVHMFYEVGETKIFEKVGSNAIFYGEVLAGAAMPNLMYMTSYENMESNKEHWAAFRKHPDWEVLKNKPEYANTVSHIDKWLLHPTDYSDL